MSLNCAVYQWTSPSRICGGWLVVERPSLGSLGAPSGEPFNMATEHGFKGNILIIFKSEYGKLTELFYTNAIIESKAL
jgi:hypothetical protein